MMKPTSFGLKHLRTPNFSQKSSLLLRNGFVTAKQPSSKILFSQKSQFHSSKTLFADELSADKWSIDVLKQSHQKPVLVDFFAE